jgi:hypothetical protein
MASSNTSRQERPVSFRFVTFFEMEHQREKGKESNRLPSLSPNHGVDVSVLLETNIFYFCDYFLSFLG